MLTLKGPQCSCRQGARGKGAERPEGPAGEAEPLGTFAGAIWPPEHSALVYGPKRLEHLPDVLICLLLP